MASGGLWLSSFMLACFCDILGHMQWILMIFIQNGRSSLDLQFDILHLIFGIVWWDRCRFQLTDEQYSCTVSVSFGSRFLELCSPNPCDSCPKIVSPLISLFWYIVCGVWLGVWRPVGVPTSGDRFWISAGRRTLVFNQRREWLADVACVTT